MGSAVITNGHIRPLVALIDLPKDAQKEFDYLGKDVWMPRFVQYRGQWYDVCDTQTIDERPFGFPAPHGHPLHGWACVATDSAFSGTVFRFPTVEQAFQHDVHRFEYVVVGRWIGE